MSPAAWLELCELAERHCRAVLLDLPRFTVADELVTLRWLRRLERERADG